tara:strand:- start:492 stop:617 length:126 start_codon:yes stop_codon:yes gene_type:complete
MLTSRYDLILVEHQLRSRGKKDEQKMENKVEVEEVLYRYIG